MEVMAKYNIRPGKIWNTDESGCPTVLPPPNVIATKGFKQVQQTVSAERGVNTTIVGFISDTGISCRPYTFSLGRIFFPRWLNEDHLVV